MDDKISILIADDNADFVEVLARLIGNEPDMKVAGTAENGAQALDMMNSTEPDFVLLDILMPYLDGIAVLEVINKNKKSKRPYIIVISSIQQDQFITKTLELGADYYLMKPICIENLFSHIRQIHNGRNYVRTPGIVLNNLSGFAMDPAQDPCVNEKKYEIELKTEIDVTRLMNNIGIPPHIIGFNYIRDAVIRTVSDYKSVIPFKKVLYPAIAEKYGINSEKVERSIKNAIKNTWTKKGSIPNKVLYGKEFIEKGRPTNTEFIAIMADKIKISNVTGENK
jgi:two-component system, response regulator, stage 0 sporulation protein A